MLPDGLCLLNTVASYVDEEHVGHDLIVALGLYFDSQMHFKSVMM